MNTEQLNLECILNTLSDLVLKYRTPLQFVRLVDWWLNRLGADKVERLEISSEENDEFRVVKIEKTKEIIIVQIRKYSLNKYSLNRCTFPVPSYRNLPIPIPEEYRVKTWVITLCDDYFQEANKSMHEINAHLINRADFAKIIIKEGVENMPRQRRGDLIVLKHIRRLEEEMWEHGLESKIYSLLTSCSVTIECDEY